MTRTRHRQPLPDARGNTTPRPPRERPAPSPREVTRGTDWARYQPSAPDEQRANTPTRAAEPVRGEPKDARGRAAALSELRRALMAARHERRHIRRALALARRELAAGEEVGRARVALAEAERALVQAREADGRASARDALIAWLRAREMAGETSAGAGAAGPEVREHVLNAMRADDTRRAARQAGLRAGVTGLAALLFGALGVGTRWLWLVALVAALVAGYLTWRWRAEWLRYEGLRETLAASERRMIEREALGRVCRRLGGAPEDIARLEERLRAVGVAVPASLVAGWAELARWPEPEERREAVAMALQAAVGLVERRRALLEVALARLSVERRARDGSMAEASVLELERRLAETEARLGGLAERARALGVAARPGALAVAYGAARAESV